MMKVSTIPTVVVPWAMVLFALVCAGSASGWTGQADLRQTRAVPWRGHEVVHLQQHHRGVPVVGAGLVTSLGRDGAFEVHADTRREDLDVDVTAEITPEQAMEVARAAVDHARSATATLAVLPTGSGGRLVYRVELSSAFPVRWWMVTVDAIRGEPLRVDDLVRHAEGWVYEHNPINSALITVELEDLHSVYGGGTMYGDYAMACTIVFSGSSVDCDFLATSTGGGDFFYEPDDPSVDDPFAEVMVYHHLTQLSHHFEDVHGHEFPEPATAYVNYRESDNGTYENAGYANVDGYHLFLFGQGEMVDFGYDGDVIAHEFGHAVVHGRTDLVHGSIATYDEFGGNVAPGALDEGMADYWACTYHDDPVQGEYISVAMDARELTNDHTCPEDVVGESHGDGQIPGGAMWDVRDVLGRDLTDEIVYEALGLLSSSPSLREFAEAVATTAEDMVEDGDITAADADAVDDILHARGLYACGRSVPLEDGVATTLHLGHLEGYGMETLSPNICNTFRADGVRFDSRFQWELQLPPAEEGEVLEIELDLDIQRLDGQDVDGDDLQFDVYGRVGAMVTFDISDVTSPGLAVPVPIPTVRSHDGFWGGEPGTVRITRADLGGMTLSAGATLYFAAVHMNCPATALTITPHLTIDAPEVAGDDDEDDVGGCECALAAPGTCPTGLVGLGVLGLVLRRRRQPRPASHP